MSRYFSRLLPSVGALAIMACSSAAFAAPIVIESGNPGSGQSETCANIFNSNTTCTTVTPHPSWQPNDPTFSPGAPGFTDLNPSGAVWISYDKTGVSPDNVVVPQNTSTPSMTVTYTFLAPANAHFIGKVWADDTAGIYLDGLFLNGADLDTTPSSPTSPSFGAGGSFAINTFLGGGGGGGGSTTHTLVIQAYQVGDGTTNDSNPFGTLFVGEVNPDDVMTVPEPTSLFLFGAGMLSLGLARRVRRKD